MRPRAIHPSELAWRPRPAALEGSSRQAPPTPPPCWRRKSRPMEGYGEVPKTPPPPSCPRPYRGLHKAPLDPLLLGAHSPLYCLGTGDNPTPTPPSLVCYAHDPPAYPHPEPTPASRARQAQRTGLHAGPLA